MNDEGHEVKCSVYTVLPFSLVDDDRKQYVAEKFEEPLTTVYDPRRVDNYDLSRSVPPHFKITSLNQVLNWLTPSVSHIAEVDVGDLGLLEREYPGHNDGFSSFTTYTGYCAPVIRTKKLFDLTNLGDVETLIWRGLFKNENDIGGGHEAMFTDWLFESGNVELYFEWKERLSLDDYSLMRFVLKKGDRALLDASLRRVNVSVGALCDALGNARAEPLADPLFGYLAQKGGELSEYAPQVLKALAAQGAWHQFATVARFLEAEQVVENWLLVHGFKIPENDLRDFLVKNYSRSQPPEGLVEILILRHRLRLIEPWLDRLRESSSLMKWLNLALLAGFDELVERLDPSGELRARLEHIQSPRLEEVFLDYRARLTSAIRNPRWYTAVRCKVLPEERKGLDPLVVKAVEAGYFGLIRWLDCQNVDVRPSGNITARVARKRGYDVMADYLDNP